jgi:hypothetical protein
VNADEWDVWQPLNSMQQRARKGNLAEASVELALERALSLAFFKEGSACGKELNPDGCCRSASVEVNGPERFGSPHWTISATG